MAATLNTFKKRFPEFVDVDDTYLQDVLNAAILEIDADVWGPKADEGHMYLTAHKLALSPWGQAARVVPNGEKTTYGSHYRSLQRQVSSGWRVC